MNRWIIIVFGVLWAGMLSAQNPLLNYPLDTIDGEIFYKYAVERSIGLYRVSIKFGVSQDEILKYNPDITKTGLRYGETVLTIPSGVKAEVKEEGPMYDVRGMEEGQKDEGQEVSVDTVPIGVEVEVPWEERTDTMPLLEPMTWHDTTVTKRVALVLPLHAKAIERDESMDRFFEFYAGVLMALKDVQTEHNLYRLYVYDSERSTEAIRRLWERDSLRYMDAIIGPAYPAQVLVMGDSALRAQVPVVVPFIDKVVGIEKNPWLFQFNASDARRAAAIASYLKQQGDSLIQIILPEAKESNIPAAIRQIRSAIRERELPVVTTTIQNILDDSLGNVLAEDKENYLLFNTERYSNLSVLMPYIRRAAVGKRVTLIGQYSWQTENIGLPQIFTSVFAAHNDSLRTEYDRQYNAYFRESEHVSQYPRYDLLGYDIMRALDAQWKGEQYEGLQSNIVFEQTDSLGGYENIKIDIVEK